MADQYGIYPEGVARELLNFYREMKAIGALRPGALRKLLQITQPPKPIYWNVYNISGQTIPPYSCVQVTGTTDVAGTVYLEVDLPADASGENGPYVFTDHVSIEPFKYGVVQQGRKARATIESGSTDAGTKYQPVVGQTYIEAADSGPFVMAGPDLIQNNSVTPGRSVVQVFLQGSSSGSLGITFTISSAFNASGSGDFGAYKSASCTVVSATCGNYDLVGDTVTVYDIAGCYFDEDNATLEDRTGHAEWRVKDNSGETDCYWECVGLCCPPA